MIELINIVLSLKFATKRLRVLMGLTLLYLYTYLLSWAISAADIENLLRNNIICLVVCRINTIFAV